jgi:hypothetical protein
LGRTISFHIGLREASPPERYQDNQVLSSPIAERAAKAFLERIDKPEKNWKFGQSDIEERKLWKHNMKVYGNCLCETSTKHGPWYIVPADDKWNACLIISQIILDTLKGLKMSYPEPTRARRKEMLSIREVLERQLT